MITDTFRCAAPYGVALLLFVANASAADVAREQNFDANWRFLRADAAGAELADFNDSAWRVLDVPHDWSIEDLPAAATTNSSSQRVGPFDPAASAGGPATGHMLGSTGWYRKHFTLLPGEAGKRVSVRFDGVYMDADVWLNGRHLGNHPYGYTPFAFNLTPGLKPPGETNVLAIRVRNEGQNSRWYSGSGIDRHVVLTVTDPLQIAEYGLQITTPQISPQTASVQLRAEIVNDRGTPATVTVRARVIDWQGKTAAQGQGQIEIPAGSPGVSVQELTVTSPRLWSLATPNLYRAEVGLAVNGKVVDVTTATFGIRRVEVDAERGFRLNGEPIKLRGGCLHHDNGPLGSAAIDRAEERRVELMKEFGFNAIRTSHNPPSPAFLDACDRLGLLVLDEAFDCWERGKKPEDYHRFFDDWSDRDIGAMVRRDRNHPSVIMWSIGNEIPERFDRPDIAGRLRATVLSDDTTRPVTAAINPMWEPENRQRDWETDSDPAFQYLDIGGYNYQPQKFASDHARHPERVMMTTESFPKDLFEYWTAVEEHPYVIGDFVWTGMDYLGESGIGHTSLDNEKDDFLKPWPWFDAYCGDIDLCGFKKPQSYFRDVIWNRSALTMAVQAPVPDGRREMVSAWGWPDERQSWTWPGQEGKPMLVTVYSRDDKVQLELNGKIIGEQAVSPATKFTARFEVPYVPGELRAVGFVNGRNTNSVSLITAGAAVRLQLTPDRAQLHASRNDLSYVTVTVVDKDGNRVPDAAFPVRFTVTGVGGLAATGSGNPSDAASFQAPRRTTFEGRCLAIARPDGQPGEITMRAEADGLTPAITALHVH